MRTATALLLLLGTAATVHAQNPSIFVEGALFRDSEARRTATAPGGGATVGIRLSPHLSIRFDSEFPASAEHSYSYPVNCAPPYCTYVENGTITERTTTYAVMFGGHFEPHRSIDVALLGGLSSADHRSGTRWSEEHRAPDGTVVRRAEYAYRFDYRSAAVSFGAEASFSVNRHLAVVPELRAHVYPYSMIVRPQIAVRWTF